MLEYKHVFNTLDLTKPFHIHQIASDKDEVAIAINGKHIAYFKPNKGNRYIFSKFLSLENNFFDLIVSGTLAEYDSSINKSIFNEANIIYIVNQEGKKLYRNLDDNLYYWEENTRTRFFFNPYYFDSEYLWTSRYNTVPTAVKCSRQWPIDLEQQLFTNKLFITSESWIGGKALTLVPPLVLDYYNNDTFGTDITIGVDYLIDLPQLFNGDILTLKTTGEELSIKVKNCPDNILTYEVISSTNRPMIHVPVSSINPNGLTHITTGLLPGQSKELVVDVYDKTIHLTVNRN